jgi:hypothetical protein
MIWDVFPWVAAGVAPQVAFWKGEVTLGLDGFQLTVHGLRLLASSPRSQAVSRWP